MANPKKDNQIQQISQLLQSCRNFIVINHHRVPHQLFEEIRKKLKKTNANLQVVKNTLFQKGLRRVISTNQLFRILDKQFFPLRHSSAIIYFKSDWSQALTTINPYFDADKGLTFKFGLLDNQVYNQQQLTDIANLPPKSQLFRQIITSLRSPLARLNSSFKFNITDIIYIFQHRH